MNKKESTPAREACRRYEAKNKEKRKANNATFFTFVTRQEAEEMAEFFSKGNEGQKKEIQHDIEQFIEQLRLDL